MPNGESQQSPEQAAYIGFAEEAEARNYGTSESDLKAYAEAAGGAAAAAGCAAAGAAALAPACAYAGGVIAGAIFDAVSELFGQDNSAEILKAQRHAWSIFENVQHAVIQSYDATLSGIDKQLCAALAKENVPCRFAGKGGIVERVQDFGFEYPTLGDRGEWAIMFERWARCAAGAHTTIDDVWADKLWVDTGGWQGKRCGGTMGPGSISADKVISGQWTVVWEVYDAWIIERAKEYRKALLAAAAPEIGLAAARKAQREQGINPDGESAAPVLVVGGGVAAAFVWWFFLR